ncbi:alpha/beta hydrolase [Niveispirillum sp. KHB5.9]|uniref:alpha/beta hydrolase n=1 Tax=Niveispirillum sp. KHB5.9 TaxID=3400269 RepID=UPI003A83AD9D
MKTVSALALVFLLACLPAVAQQKPPGFPQNVTATPIPAPPEAGAVPLYNGVAPGSEGARQVEQWNLIFGDKVVRNVTRPTLTPFLPDPAKATGAAVIVAPGGAYMMLAMEQEGWKVAKWLADQGIAAFVLKYRLDEDPAAFLRVAGERFGAAARAGADKVPPIHQPLAIADGQQALRLVRAKAGEWKIDPARVGMIGFSAGAMTALQVTLANLPDARPDFVGLIYGPTNHVSVPAGAPPMFTALAADDPLFGRSGFGLVEAWQKAGSPVELHFYERGDHGFGMKIQGTTSDLWPGQFHTWLKVRGLLSR